MTVAVDVNLTVAFRLWPSARVAVASLVASLAASLVAVAVALLVTEAVASLVTMVVASLVIVVMTVALATAL